MWERLEPEEQLNFINSFAGATHGTISADLVHLCEARLDYVQRTAYVDAVSAYVAAVTYAKISPDNPAASEAFYFNLLHVEAKEKARMLWYVLNSVQA
jgi:hypothetical protein